MTIQFKDEPSTSASGTTADSATESDAGSRSPLAGHSYDEQMAMVSPAAHIDPALPDIYAESDDADGRKEFAAGAAAFKKGAFQEAYDRFMAAFDIVYRPNLLFSAAQSLKRLGGRDAEAIELYQRYLDTGGGTREDDARAELKELQEPAMDVYEESDDADGRKEFAVGAAAFKKGAYQEAYDHFMAAYQIVYRPNLVFSAAQSLKRLGGRDAEAIALYERYLDMGGGTREDEAMTELKELQESTKDVS